MTIRNNRPLCVAICAIPGRHAEDCSDEQCRGCLVALAADGLMLCRHHTDGIARDAGKLADLHGEIGLRLTGSGTAGEKTSGTRDPGLSLDGRAADMRDEINAVLVSWCKLIGEERGIYPPKKRVVKLLPMGFIGPPPLVWTVDDSPHALSVYIATHAEWLAAHPAAADASNELRELVRRAWGIAYPSGTRRFQVKHDGKPVPCPIPDGDKPCPGTLWTILRRTDSLLPSALACDVNEHHEIPADRWLTLGRQLRRAA